MERYVPVDQRPERHAQQQQQQQPLVNVDEQDELATMVVSKDIYNVSFMLIMSLFTR
jgi:hypothetical protein